MATNTTAQSQSPTSQSSSNVMSDFFSDTSESQYQKVKLLGFEHFVMDNGEICRTYEIVNALADDTARFGVIPQLISFDKGLADAFKRVKSWPTILEVEIVVIPGSKNKSQRHIKSIKAGSL